MKKVFSFLMFSLILSLFLLLTFSLGGQKLKKLEGLQLEENEESAVSIDSPEEYENMTPLKEEKKPTIRMVGYYIEPEFIPEPDIIKEEKEIEKANKEQPQKQPQTNKTSLPQDKNLNQTQNKNNKIVFWAKEFLAKNTKTVVINGKQVAINTDCSNFVRAVYWKALEVDLFYESVSSGAANSNAKSGCLLLHAYFSKKHRFNKNPKAGDIVFFDNTYDKNLNKKWDDPLTHVGLVENIEKDGTVSYIHGNTGSPKAIKKAYLNIKYPSTYQQAGKTINTYLRKKYEWETVAQRKQLSGQLVKGFGGY